ncbi:MAG: ABC transporter permease subunit, partial [Angelakisella sp.]
DTGRNLSMKPLAVTCEIMVRASAGYALSGIKIGWARAWRALISAEMAFGAVGLLGGIGWYILKQRTFMNTSGLFAGIVVVIILGILVEDVLFATVEKHTVQKWGMSSKN